MVEVSAIGTISSESRKVDFIKSPTYLFRSVVIGSNRVDDQLIFALLSNKSASG